MSLGNEDLAGEKFLQQQGDIHDVNMLALEHFLLHHKVILKKLHHLQDATRRSIRDIEAQHENSTKEIDRRQLLALKECAEQYDAIWIEIIDKFKVSAIDEAGLGRIERTISTIPRIIKKIYDVLLKKDVELIGMIKELAAEKYKKALAVVRKVQGKKDRMSGLDLDEFDEDAQKVHEEKERVDAVIYDTH